MHRSTLPRSVSVLLPLALAIACGPGDDGTGAGATAGTTASTGETPTPSTSGAVTGEPTDSGATEQGTGTTAGEDATVNYHRDIKALLDTRCVQCHSPGNIAPFSLTTYEAAKPFAMALADSADDGSMPPWPPDNGCRTYAHDRSLPEAERALLRTWAELGAPEGDPADAPPAPDAPDEVIDYDIELALPAPYQPTLSPDEYRCFLIDWPKDQESFVTALDVIPGDRRLVHHVIAYAIEPQDVDTYRGLEAADPDPGYVCYGGPGASAESQFRVPWLGAWVPGAGSGAMPAGTGLRVAPGSVIALQMHYHSYPGAGADQSKLRLRTAPSVERPAVIMPFTDIDWVLGTKKMEIPAGEPDVVHSFELDMTQVLTFLFPNGPFAGSGPFIVHSAGLHQHTLGTTSKLQVVRGGGSGDECLLDIPRWDFDWQGTYELGESVRVDPGDRMRIECHWDNSAANQPIVDGVQQEPKTLGWGEGTGDEMCLGLMYVTAP